MYGIWIRVRQALRVAAMSGGKKWKKNEKKKKDERPLFLMGFLAAQHLYRRVEKPCFTAGQGKDTQIGQSCSTDLHGNEN